LRERVKEGVRRGLRKTAAAAEEVENVAPEEE